MADIDKIKETVIGVAVVTTVFVGVIAVSRALGLSPFRAARVPTQARVGGAVRSVTGRH